MNKRRTAVVVSICLCLVTLCLISTWNIRRDFTKIESALNASEVEIYSRLNSAHYELIESYKADFQKMLRVGASHTIHSKLNKFIIASQIKEISLYNKDCNLIASSSSGVPLNSLCRNFKADQTFYWASPTIPASVHRLALVKFYKTPVIIEVTTQIKKSWLNESLSSSEINKYKIKLNKLLPDSSPIIRLSDSLAIYSDSWQYIYYKSSEYTDWLMLALFGLFSLWLFVQGSLYISNKINASLKLKSKTLEFLRSWDGYENSTEDLNTLMNSVKSDWINREFEARIKYKKLQEKVEIQKVELIELERELSLLKNLESLKKQIRTSSQQFLALNQENISQSEDIYDTILRAIVPICQNLYSQTLSWSEGLETLSPRKFFRTLSERTVENGRTQLDCELSSLQENCTKLGNLSIQLSLLSQKLCNRISQVNSIAEHWAGLVDHSKDVKGDLSSLLMEAQMLVPLVENIPPVKFENKNILNKDVSNIAPPATWKTILYHLYLACLECCPKSQETHAIYTSAFSKENKYIVVISKNKSSEVQDHLPSEAKKHFQLAQSIGGQYKLDIFTLPFSNGDTPLAVCWEAEDTQKFSMSSNISSKSRSLSRSSFDV